MKDIARASLAGQPIVLEELMMQPLVVLDGTPVLKLLEGFRREGLHMAIVVDEYGATQGVVTLADIIEAVAGTLPEAGGELLQSAVMLKRNDGSWLVDGSFGIDEFEDRLGIAGPAAFRSVRYRRRLRAVSPRPVTRRRRHLRRPHGSLRDRRHGRTADRQAHLSAARRGRGLRPAAQGLGGVSPASANFRRTRS